MTADIFSCTTNLQKALEKYFTFTLRNKSFSLAVASLECMKLFKAVFAAVNIKQKNVLLFGQEMFKIVIHKKKNLNTFSLFLNSRSKFHSVSLRRNCICYYVDYKPIRESQLCRCSGYTEEDLLIVCHAGVRGTHGNGEQQHVVRMRLPGQRVKEVFLKRGMNNSDLHQF